MEKLMKSFSFNKDKIIRFRKDLEYLDLNCIPLEEERKELISKLWWSNGYKGSYEGIPYWKEALEAKKRLLEFGGEDVCMPFVDDDILGVLERGQFWEWSSNRVKKVEGIPSECHKNSSLLWKCNKDKVNIKICTGYGLSDDGLWRQHSWTVYLDTDGPKIVETTEERLAYYGFVLTEIECEKFFKLLIRE